MIEGRHIKKSPTLKDYKREKVRMLTEDFLIRMTADEKEHLYILSNEIQVDNYARKLIMKGD